MEKLEKEFLNNYYNNEKTTKKKSHLTTKLFYDIDKEINKFFKDNLEKKKKKLKKMVPDFKKNKKIISNEFCNINKLIEKKEILNCFSILDNNDDLNYMISSIKKNNSRKILILDLGINKNKGFENFDDNILIISVFQKIDLFQERKECKNFLLYSINKIENQYVGENDFIYLFERLIFPIIKNFKPDFIFFITDFYINKKNKQILNLTQDTFMYYLYKLKNEISEKIHFILKIKNKENFFKENRKEIFKNNFEKKNILKNIKGILSILKGDYFPNKTNNIQMNLKNLQISCRPILLFVKNLKENQNRWKKYYNFLENKNLLDYERKIVKQLYCSFAGGHFHFFKIMNQKIEKKLKKKEYIFYLETYPLMKKLKDIGPKVFEIIKKENNYYLIMENLDPNKNFSLLDFKIYGNINKKKHYLSSLFKKYHLGLAGYKILNDKKIVIEKSRSNFVRYSKEETLRAFSRFFLTKNKNLFLEGILKIIFFLKKLENIIFDLNYDISTGSIFILFDPVDNEFKIKLIDFTYFGIKKNQNVRFSIKMAIKLFLEFYQFSLKYNKESKCKVINN